MTKKSPYVTLDALNKILDEKFDAFARIVQAGFKSCDAQFSEIFNRLDGVDKELSEVRDDLNGVKDDLSEVRDDLSQVKSNTFGLDNRMSKLEDKMRVVYTKLKL